MVARSALSALLVAGLTATALQAQPLANTKPLTAEGDLAAQMVAGIDRFLTRELAASVERRRALWQPDYSSPEAYARSVQAKRDRLARLLGVVDKRLPVTDLDYVATTGTEALVSETESYTIYAVRWPVFEGVDADGLLLEPKGKPVACVVAVPDADWSPEMLVGLAPGVPREAQFARRLVEDGCRVLIPALIDRRDTWSGSTKLGRRTNQPHREFIYRMAFEMGRHIIGYEIQKVLAAVDWFAREKEHPPIGVFGCGEGGLLALYSGALDPRIQTTTVAGYFGPREELWREPIYRNVWGLLREFGDAELALLIAPRALTVYCHAECAAPEKAGPPPAREGRSGAAPGRIQTPPVKAVEREAERVGELRRKMQAPPGQWDSFLIRTGQEQFSPGDRYAPKGQPPPDRRKGFDPAQRQQRQFDQLVAFTQRLMRDADFRRHEFFWSKADLSSPERWQKSTEALRQQFGEEVIGSLPNPTESANPRTRLVYDRPKWKGYEVVLDLYPDVFANGILLVPNDLRPDERRPVVVCQHGLEGRPQDVVNPKEKTRYYNSFGAQLADRGYIVYAPQNPYIGRDNFRALQRKANPLRLSLFSFIVRQHERTLDWLADLPFVDAERLAFYGLSYGGKTAMRVPALLPRYCLSICSGDFNEWVWKNVSVDFRGSYMFTGEYEMFEFNLGNTYNYAEMAGLIAPRPFMVERGHDDGVGIDEWVAYEYAKVRRLYAKLKLPERTAIEFFPGGHEINGQGTFAFLRQHLRWPQ
jgi:dienelactone hydrolase